MHAPDPIIQLSGLLKYWDTLQEEEQKNLAYSIRHIDPRVWHQQIQVLAEDLVSDTLELPCPDWIVQSTSPRYQESGFCAIQEGRVGVVVLAGGEGSRLQFTGPKGCYPILPTETLFSLLAKKILQASEKAQRPLSLAIMTSPRNHAESVAHFEVNNYFGLQKSQLFFFTQTHLPLLNEEGQPFLTSPSTLAEGPDGNGRALYHFLLSSAKEAWEQQGVEYLQVLPVDNPLANPYDEELIGFHRENQLEISLRSIPPKKPEEKLGRLVCRNNKPCIIEYTELPPTLMEHTVGNTGLFCFSLSFLKQQQNQLASLPLHKAWKKTFAFGLEKWAWKFETFIFDALPLSNHFRTLLSERNTCFAPLKNAFGEDSPETVRALLQNRDEVV